MKELELDYSVRVENMVPLEGEYDGWTIEDGDFYSNEGETVVMPYLLSDSDSKQIFKMDDGRFVLEIENEDCEIDYFYSYDIEDLL
jgi:hypothetical protein